VAKYGGTVMAEYCVVNMADQLFTKFNKNVSCSALALNKHCSIRLRFQSEGSQNFSPVGQTLPGQSKITLIEINADAYINYILLSSLNHVTTSILLLAKYILKNFLRFPYTFRCT
jgi:hypothetical protein